MNRKRNFINIFTNKLLLVFSIFFTICLSAIALKLLLGIIWSVGGLYFWYGDLHWIIQAVVSMILVSYVMKWTRGTSLWELIKNAWCLLKTEKVKKESENTNIDI